MVLKLANITVGQELNKYQELPFFS